MKSTQSLRDNLLLLPRFGSHGPLFMSYLLQGRIRPKEVIHNWCTKTVPISRIHQVMSGMIVLDTFPKLAPHFYPCMDNIMRPFVKEARSGIANGCRQGQSGSWQYHLCNNGCHCQPPHHEFRRINGNVKVWLGVMLLVNFFSIPIASRMQQLLMQHVFVEAPKDNGG